VILGVYLGGVLGCSIIFAMWTLEGRARITRHGKPAKHPLLVLVCLAICWPLTTMRFIK
jgi:hypothetical protein